MEELKKNKVFLVLVGVTALNIVIFFLGKFFIEKAADRVIQKLQKEYSPSPYGPGFDPDRVNTDAFKANRRFFEVKTNGSGAQGLSLQEKVKASDVWREKFEIERGANPEQ